MANNIPAPPPHTVRSPMLDVTRTEESGDSGSSLGLKLEQGRIAFLSPVSPGEM
jgi:hypothetical protein